MAWNQSPDTEVKTSKFNAGILKMQRLHEIWDKINKLNQIPLGSDEITGEENYKLLYRCYNSLFLEAYPKLSPDQKKLGEKIRIVVGNLIKAYPVRKNLKRNNNSDEVVFKEEHWEKIEEGLFIYEKTIREFIDATGMDNPEEDDYDGL